MANITESNTLIEETNSNGDVVRHFPITKVENIIGIENIKGASAQQLAALKLLAANAFIIDDTTGKTYKIGSNDGKFYFEESDVSVLDLLNEIVSAAATLSEKSEN